MSFETEKMQSILSLKRISCQVKKKKIKRTIFMEIPSLAN